MTTYSFCYRREGKWFWTKIYFVKGHQHDVKTDVMTVFLKGGGLRTIRKWKECEIYLGDDFGDFVKEQVEKDKAGVGIK
jgi:hypothetical protein